MTTENETARSLIEQIIAFERQNGRAPTIRELARNLKMKGSELRALIGRLLAEDRSDGTSAFGASLRDILLGGAANTSPIINQHPSGHQVSLMEDDVAPLGRLPVSKSQKLASEKDLSLFLLKPDVELPEAQLVDYQRFQQELEKRAQAQKLKQEAQAIKEVRLRYNINDRDFETKVRSIEKFLTEGFQIKVVVSLPDVDNDHVSIARARLSRLVEELTGLAMVLDEPTLERLTLVVSLVLRS